MVISEHKQSKAKWSYPYERPEDTHLWYKHNEHHHQQKAEERMDKILLMLEDNESY